LRILIIKTSALGDIIHALPVLSYLHQAAPGARIDWVVEEAFQELLSGNPLIDRLITVAFKRWRKSPFALHTLREVGDFRRYLQEREYDIVFDIQGNLKSGLVCWLANSQRKIGFSREHLQESLNSLFTTQQVAFRPEDCHARDRYLRIVSHPFDRAASQQELTTDIYTSPEDDGAAQAIITSSAASGPVFLVHSGTTWQTKLWYEQGWTDLATRLLVTFPASSIMFSWGNESEQRVVRRIVAGIGDRSIILERLPLKRFIALLKKVDLVVGGDTGPVHLAAAVGTPTVSFYRCTDGSLNGPCGENHAIVQSPLTCTKCLNKSCERDSECSHSITVDDMYNAVVALMGQASTSTTPQI